MPSPSKSRSLGALAFFNNHDASVWQSTVMLVVLHQTIHYHDREPKTSFEVIHAFNLRNGHRPSTGWRPAIAWRGATFSVHQRKLFHHISNNLSSNIMTEIEYNWFLTMYQHLVCYLVIFMSLLHNKAKQEFQIILQNRVSFGKLYIQQKLERLSLKMKIKNDLVGILIHKFLCECANIYGSRFNHFRVIAKSQIQKVWHWNEGHEHKRFVWSSIAYYPLP